MLLEIQIFNVEEKHEESHTTKTKRKMKSKLIITFKRIL